MLDVYESYCLVCFLKVLVLYEVVEVSYLSEDLPCHLVKIPIDVKEIFVECFIEVEIVWDSDTYYSTRLYGLREIKTHHPVVILVYLL